MKLNNQKTLSAAAAAALVSFPAWSAPDISSSDFEVASARYGQAQESTSRDRHDHKAHDEWDKDVESHGMLGSNPFYSRTPDELSGMDVIGADGETIGKIKTVVMDENGMDIHAVISSGGVLGIGDRETVVPLDELTMRQDDKVGSKLTAETIESRPEFEAERYGVMESDRRISDLSAFKPKRMAAAQVHERDKPEARRSTTVAETIDNPLHRYTPKDLEGMMVFGKDGENLGRIKAVVASNDRAEVNAVVATGGFLGIGARDVLMSLDQLMFMDEDELEADATQDTVRSLPQYQAAAHTKLDPDRPIGEYWHESR